MAGHSIILKRLVFLGPLRPPAAVDFNAKLTVVCGASDTGKSFIVEAIDFLLGATGSLRDIPERIGYDRLRLQLGAGTAGPSTLERSVSGRDFRHAGIYVIDDVPMSDDDTLKAAHRHNETDNLSGWLLNNIGLPGRRIKRNKAGATSSLSFRNLAHIAVVKENDIIKPGSPYQTGQYTGATSEYATLKLLLTGIDDSSVVDARVVKAGSDSDTGKLEVIDAMLADLQGDLADVEGREELTQRYERLGSTIEDVQGELERVRGTANEAMSLRREATMERNRKQERVDEITELLGRFELLVRHYASDVLRLESIRESGSLFTYLPAEPCPLCGTPAADQHHSAGCDGDTASIVASAASEIDKIQLLQHELDDTRRELQAETQTLRSDIADFDTQIRSLNLRIETLLAPALTRTQVSFRELADTRTKVSRDLEIYQRIDKLQAQREEITGQDDEDEGSAAASVDLSKTVLDELAITVETILKDWHFPAAERVYFDETTKDFVISGKPRGSFGKGFRAITHAAATIGLMEFCLKRDLSHPGFVILDSPLMAYWEPEGAADSLVGTDLKDRFYEFLQSDRFLGQAIIIENEHPTITLDDPGMAVVFTRNPSEGRFGLFPVA